MVLLGAGRHHMPVAAVRRAQTPRDAGQIMPKLDSWLMGALGLTLLVLMPGCGGESVSPGARWREQVKENTSPTQGIDFTWTVRDAPGPFEKVVARAQYDVINSGECGYVQPATGTPIGMITSRDVPLEKVSDVELKGRVFEDLLLDGNYYGRAQCRWGLTGLHVIFLATGAEGETEFQIFMDRADLAAGETQRLFYPGKDYPRTEGHAGYPAFGVLDFNEYTPKYREGAFSASVVSQGGVK